MWTDSKITPTRYVSLVMLVIYLSIALFLFIKLRSLDIPTIVKSFSGSEENEGKTANKAIPDNAKKEAKKIASRYTDTLIKELDSVPERMNRSSEPQIQYGKSEIFFRLMCLDGKLAMAPTVEPYFARR